jgi:hypothetical protein
MILAALEIEVEEYQRQHRDARDRRGYALVVRNGQARPRRLTVGTGTITLRAPRVNDRRRVDGVRQRFTSQILPPLFCAARLRSAPCCRCCNSMASRPGTSARRCQCCSEKTRRGSRPPRSRA